MNTPINETSDWRKRMGLSQQALADYLGVSRSLLALVETGRRILPTTAYLALHELQCMAVAGQQHVAQKSPPATATQWQEQKETLERKLARLERRYKKIAKQQAHALGCACFFKELGQHVEGLAPSEQSKGKKLWLDNQLTHSQNKAKPQSHFQLQQLELEIATLQFQIQKIEHDWLTQK